MLNEKEYTSEICIRCKGECCKSSPGIYHPNDFGNNESEIKKNIMKRLKEGNIQFDCWEGDPRDEFQQIDGAPEYGLYRAYHIRPSIVGHLELFYPAWVGACTFLSDNGCSLAFDERPDNCKRLMPLPQEKSRCKIDGVENPKRYYTLLWLPYYYWIDDIIYEER